MKKIITKPHLFKRVGVAAVVAMTSLASCSTLFQSAPPHSLPLTDLQKIGKFSRIEIEYVLGRSHYQLQFRANGGGVETENKIDKKTIIHSMIEFESYIDYLQKTLVFVQQTQELKISGDPQTCRSPFKVTVQLSQQHYVAHGCRTQDNGNLSKIVKQGEFLVYSKI